jgi:hypothetical protein
MRQYEEFGFPDHNVAGRKKKMILFEYYNHLQFYKLMNQYRLYNTKALLQKATNLNGIAKTKNITLNNFHGSTCPHSTPKEKMDTLFLGVSHVYSLLCSVGFLAENQREHMVEHQREKEFMKSMLEDLRN